MIENVWKHVFISNIYLPPLNLEPSKQQSPCHWDLSSRFIPLAV